MQRGNIVELEFITKTRKWTEHVYVIAQQLIAEDTAVFVIPLLWPVNNLFEFRYNHRVIRDMQKVSEISDDEYPYIEGYDDDIYYLFIDSYGQNSPMIPGLLAVRKVQEFPALTFLQSWLN